jgi:acyl-CoA reductase-like NAD-dependent aldehyde dehydrogenase
MQGALGQLRAEELVAICERAAGIFVHDALPLGDASQGPDDYVRQTSATTGLPHVMVRRNMEKVRGVLAGMRGVLAGLTRGLDLAVLDTGRGSAGAHALGYVPRGATLGVVLPSNSPGVHALWPPAVALKTALVLKPGSAEPWTPWRVVQALVRAGAPPEAFGYYPSEHAGGAEVLRHSGRGMVFGDVAATRRYLSDPRVEVHGPGYSKVMLGPDAAPEWRRHLDVIATSIAENSGRSCINASAVWTTAHADALADALAERLARIEPRDPEDEQAEIAPFADPRVAERLSAIVDEGLAAGGAEDVSARHRRGPRLVRRDGMTYLLPTIVRCGPDHPLANRELLFPFASVVEAPVEDMPARFGPTLALTAITADPALLQRVLRAPHVQRLNLGALPTCRVAWDQPHEGNLFEHLWARRAVLGAPGAA